MLKKFFNNLKLAMNMPEKKIITFANQKGGVGKSTLCTLFANALVEAGIPIKVLDYDRQHTIGNRRNDDLRYLNPQDPEKIIERGPMIVFEIAIKVGRFKVVKFTITLLYTLPGKLPKG